MSKTACIKSGVYILLFPQDEEVHSPSLRKDVRIQQHIHQKDLNLCVPLYYYKTVISEMKETQTRNLTVFIVLVI